MTSQISDADPSELSDLLDVDGAPLLSLTDPSRCLPPVCCCWRCVILLNVERIFEEFGVACLRSASLGWLLLQKNFSWKKFNIEGMPSEMLGKSSTSNCVSNLLLEVASR